MIAYTFKPKIYVSNIFSILSCFSRKDKGRWTTASSVKGREKDRAMNEESERKQNEKKRVREAYVHHVSQSTFTHICYSFYEGHRQLKCALPKSRDWREREKIKSLFYLHIYFVVSVGRILSISLFDLISNSGSSSSNNSNHSKKATTTSKGLIHVQCKHVMYAALNKQTSSLIIILEKTRPRVEHMTKLTNKT